MLKSENTIEVFDKNNPFLAKLTDQKSLTAPTSTKETLHFVVNITGSGMHYEPGDSLGIYPTNVPHHVNQLIQALGFTGEEPVTLRKSEHPIALREALLYHLSLSGPTNNFLKWLLERVTDPTQKDSLTSLLNAEDPEVIKEYLHNREFVDLAEEFSSAQFTLQEYVENLKRLVPRLYSIASSPKLYPDEVHLTVAVVRYQTNNKERVGVASTYLTDRVAKNEDVFRVFVSHSHFKLPEDLSADIIMVGPGTGLAPFRAFIQEHVATGGTGRLWLFFGERTRQDEYLYQEELEDYVETGKLTRLDLAFSRDQEKKIYVQDKMAQNSQELWSWVDSGAHFYVCGDAKRMAKDVEAQLLQVFQELGTMNEEESKTYFKQMKREKRYQKDVY